MYCFLVGAAFGLIAAAGIGALLWRASFSKQDRRPILDPEAELWIEI